MKEANIFEAWADRLMEGTWQTPDTPEKQSQLVKLLSTDLPVGADATNAKEQLYDLLGDDVLFDQLATLADKDANADARQVVLNRMQELADDPDVMKVINSLNIDATAAMNPPEQTPADLEPADEVQEMLGGDASDQFIADVSIKQPEDEMDEAVKDPRTQTEDPAGTKQPTYPEYAQDLMSILKHAGVPAKERVAPDYEPELDEVANPGVTPEDIDGVPEELDEIAPVVAAIGGALGRAAVAAAPRVIASNLARDALSKDDEVEEVDENAGVLSPINEKKCNMSEAGESCPIHGLKECGMEEGWGLTAVPAAETKDPVLERFQQLAAIKCN